MTVYLPDRFIALTSDGKSEKNVSELIKDVTNSSAPVKVTQLTGGITNQLLLAEQDGLKVLVRSFGKGTDNFIDRNREFAVHQSLQSLGLAPTLYCQFGNGLIYGFVSGRPTTAEELNDEYIMEQVSHRLAQWHATLKPSDVVRCLQGKPLGDFWQVLEHWVDICPDDVLPLPRNELVSEFNRLKSEIGDLGGNQIMGHCDLLSANILVPEKPDRALPNTQAKNPERDGKNNSTSNGNITTNDHDTKSLHIEEDDARLPHVPYGTEDKVFDLVASDAAFIDYEYAIPCPRAFDIANHFQEWQGYECQKDRVPEPQESSEKLKFWCEHYLHAFETLTNEKQVLHNLITELQAWWGMPGFYWGVWSAIQSKSSDIDFGYHEYATNRFQEFLDWRKSWKKS